MNLSIDRLAHIQTKETLDIPEMHLFSLPEKVLQFGTGVLLRGLPDYFIDKANKQGVFNGRVVIVKSTSQGDTRAFSAQNGLYTQIIRGIEDGKRIDKAVINAAVSRVLSATDEWQQVLDCAASPELQIIVSNTTEVGIALDNSDDIHAHPPRSFPGKLLAFLLERYTKFGGSADAGMVIIPTELIPGNGKLLQSIVLELAEKQVADKEFIRWLQTANDFCNSLVDRIVPGKLPGDDKATMESRLGYKDDLMIMSEVYRLWAVETNSDRTKRILSFAAVDKGVVLAPDIDRYRELKLRLLNGSHTFSCAVAVQMGFVTVKQAMDDAPFHTFISKLMLEEIVPAITSEKVSAAAAKQFAAAVIDRYENPFIEHHWLSIALQYSSKMKMRNVPVLLQHYAKTTSVPVRMALGFAAYLLFMKSEKNNANGFVGTAAGRDYPINDDRAGLLHHLWHSGNTDNFVANVLANEELWGSNLNLLPGFCDAVAGYLQLMVRDGLRQVLAKQEFQQIM